MSRRWIMPVAIAAFVAESWFAMSPAYADGGEALLDRLLQDQPVASATQKTTSATPARVTPRDAIRLTPDRTEIVRLDQDAASVVVTNPAHAQVMMETPRLLLVMPRTPGSTSLFVLDKQGNAILERDIIVSGATKPYVRIRKSCGGNDRNCNADSYFYCPDGCYEVATVPPSDSTPTTSVADGPLTIDTTPVPGDIPPNAQSRTEAEPQDTDGGAEDIDARDADETTDDRTTEETGTDAPAQTDEKDVDLP